MRAYERLYGRISAVGSCSRSWIGVDMACCVQSHYAAVSRITECSGLQDFINRHQRLFVSTGAGCSTRSGIPDYRDLEGQWNGESRRSPSRPSLATRPTRRRYWARSLIGWRRFLRSGK